MPPKIRVEKEDIIKAAAEIVREKGISSLNARAVAAKLGVSTQPIFSNYSTMEELKKKCWNTRTRSTAAILKGE